MFTTNDAAVVSLAEVSKGYGSGESRVTALDGVSIDFHPGTFTAVMGPSGSGKSTLLQCAAGLDRVDSGEVRLAGANPARMSESNLTKLRREKVGFIFQAFNLIPDLSIAENIEVPLRYRGFSAAERRRRIQQSLERVGLAARQRHYPAELSGGQQQRAAIARALAGTPRLLLADEPTGNLDTQMARGVMELMEELHRDGATIVMVTHDPELAIRAQREVHIVDGQVVDIATEPRLVSGGARVQNV